MKSLRFLHIFLVIVLGLLPGTLGAVHTKSGKNPVDTPLPKKLTKKLLETATKDEKVEHVKKVHRGKGRSGISPKSCSPLSSVEVHLAPEHLRRKGKGPVQLDVKAVQDIVQYQFPDCPVNEIAELTGVGGVNNLGVFSVTVDTPPDSPNVPSELIVKVLDPKTAIEEIENITTVHEEGLGRLDSFAVQRGFVQLAEDAYVSIAERAPGKSLESILRSKMAIKTKCEIMARFGNFLATVHQENMDSDLRTIVHGDCHFENVFYDAETGKFTFIDYATSAHSTLLKDRQSYLWDIMSMVIVPLLYAPEDVQVVIQQSPKIVKDCALFCKSFIDGYVAAYAEQPFLSNHIVAFVDTWLQFALSMTTKRKCMIDLTKLTGPMHEKFKGQVLAVRDYIATLHADTIRKNVECVRTLLVLCR